MAQFILIGWMYTPILYALIIKKTNNDNNYILYYYVESKHLVCVFGLPHGVINMLTLSSTSIQTAKAVRT